MTHPSPHKSPHPSPPSVPSRTSPTDAPQAAASGSASVPEAQKCSEILRLCSGRSGVGSGSGRRSWLFSAYHLQASTKLEPEPHGWFSKFGSLLGSFSKGAVKYWGPKKGPSFRERELCHRNPKPCNPRHCQAPTSRQALAKALKETMSASTFANGRGGGIEGLRGFG